MDADNLVFVREMCDALGIPLFTVTEALIVADREVGQPSLNIAPGWTNGFNSEDEARTATGGNNPLWTSRRAKGLWGVSHPRNWTRDGSGVARGQRDYGPCPTCGYELPATLKFDSCG